jgi:hypothetical protein
VPPNLDEGLLKKTNRSLAKRPEAEMHILAEAVSHSIGSSPCYRKEEIFYRPTAKKYRLYPRWNFAERHQCAEGVTQDALPATIRASAPVGTVANAQEKKTELILGKMPRSS